MTADTVGGVWTYAVELAHALAPHGVEVHLATMGRPLSPAQHAEADAFAAVHASSFPLEWQDEPWAGVDAAGHWLPELEREVRPDVVHLNGYAHAALPWRAPTLVVAHSDVLSWWRAVHADEVPAAWDTYRRRVGAGLRAAGRVVAPTSAVAADLAGSFGVDDVAVVPNCRRPGLVAPAAQKEPFVLASGRVWDAAKGLDALCRVAPSVPGRVLLAGEGDLAAEGVGVLGPLPFPELAELMSRAAVYAAPVRYEPFGLGVLEAGLAGCALVLGDVPSLREVWGDAAVFVRDDTALADALTQLLTDPALAAERGAGARERALGWRLTDPGLAAERGAAARRRALEHTPERTARGYLDLYAQLPVAAR